MRILAILMILTFSSCMVSTKVFDAAILDLQGQIDSKLPRYEFELKLTTAEHFLNEQTRCMKKYFNTNIDAHVKDIIYNVLLNIQIIKIVI